MDLIEKINKRFDNKYSYLKLFDMVYDVNSFVCTVSFLYPYKITDIGSEERSELENFVKEFFSLNCDVRVKFKRSFLDEKLIKIEVKNFFEQKHKSLVPFIDIDNISSSNVDYNVTIKISLNQDVLSMLDEGEIKQEIVKFLSTRFIAEFEINLCEIAESLPTEFDVEDILPTRPTIERYDMVIDSELFGGDIAPKPEYIKNIKKPKGSVILGGIISSFTRKSFIAKHGKRAGEEKFYYSFTINDGSSMEVIYFCTKSNEKKMEALSDGMSVICVGDVVKGLSGKLNYKIKKMALATAKPKEVVVDAPSGRHKQVVFTEPIETKAQSNLFEEKPIYNDNIMNNTFVVFDIETTGLDPETCEITEIGAVKIVNGVIKERFASFVKISGKIPKEVQEITHITDDMLRNAPSLENVIRDFYDWTRNCIISGYNIIGFDMKFIQKAGKKFGLKFDNDLLDALIIARTSNLRVSNYKLGTVVNALGITLEGAHRAYNDAHATAQVLLALSKKK